MIFIYFFVLYYLLTFPLLLLLLDVAVYRKSPLV